ncbi:MAG: Mbov_0395 family pilin-like conjugal transfer protein [Monoglobales bacterium]
MNMVLLSGTNPFQAAAEPIIELINMAATPLLAIVAALGVIYCIILGAKLAKAEEPQEREKAKGALKNAIIGFVLIFVMIVALKLMTKPLAEWMNNSSQKAGSILSTTVNFGKMFFL